MTWEIGRCGRRRYVRFPRAALPWAVALAMSFWAFTSGAARAGELSPEDKARFLEALCAPMDNHERCMNAGKLVLNRSLAWIIFEGCSASGNRDLVVACFDRSHPKAYELTGDPQFEAVHRSCTRFQGEQVAEAKLLCYRSDFKYAQNYRALVEKAEKSETGAAVLRE